MNYGVTFPMFSKIDVNGDAAHPLFKYLTSDEEGPARQRGDQVELHQVPGRQGRQVIERYAPTTKPEDLEGLGTLLVDLLTAPEELSRACVFNVALLAVRLAAITRWLCPQAATAAVPVAYFGAGTGTAAALAGRDRHAETAGHGHRVPGWPPGHGGAAGLALVRVPTLLIVGGADKDVLDLNQRARAAAEVREPCFSPSFLARLTCSRSRAPSAR